MTADLLSKLITLRPNLCTYRPGEAYFIQGWWTVLTLLDSRSLARLQASLQAAIASEGLSFSLEKGIHGYSVRVYSSSAEGYGVDAEAAIALLRAYIGYLEVT